LLENHRLILPVPDDDPFVHENESEATPHQLALTRRRLVSLAKGLDGAALSAHRLGWVALWSRAFVIFDSARSCAESGSRLGLVAAGRAAIELGVHTLAVLKPATSEQRMQAQFGGEGGISANSWNQVLDRLSAFTAWALANDRDSHQRRLRLLKETFDPSPAEDLAKDRTSAIIHEAIFGPIPRDTPEQLARDRDAARAAISERINWIGGYLTDPILAKWTQHPAFPRSDSIERGTFFSLIGDDAETLAAQLRAADLRIVHGDYSNASAILHGSSIEEFVARTADGNLFPRLTCDDIEPRIGTVVVSLTQVWLCLGLIRDRVWGTGNETS
jgi:hypothetical protein